MNSNAIGISPTDERYLQKAIQNMWNEKEKKQLWASINICSGPCSMLFSTTYLSYKTE